MNFNEAINKLLSCKSESKLLKLLEDLTLFHGTRHEIPNGEFLLEKVNTGEGAQAYGWGLYFAEARGVARYYQKAGMTRVHSLIELVAPTGEHFVVNPSRENLCLEGTNITLSEWAKNKNMSLQYCDEWIRTDLLKLLEDYLYKFDSLTQAEINEKFVEAITDGKDTADYWVERGKKRLVKQKARFDDYVAKVLAEHEELDVFSENAADLSESMDEEYEEEKAKVDALVAEIKSSELESKGFDELLKFKAIKGSNAKDTRGGNLYTLQSTADYTKCLNWDAPVSEQPLIQPLIKEFNVLLFKARIGKILLLAKRNLGEEAVTQVKQLLFDAKDFKPEIEEDPFDSSLGTDEWAELFNNLQGTQNFINAYGGENDTVITILRRIKDWKFSSLASIDEHSTGSQFYEALSNSLKSDKKASFWLKEHGIPALYYLDASSRDPDEDPSVLTHNWVIWDTSLIRAVKVEGDINKEF